MVNKENLMNLNKQTLVKSFLYDEALRKINYLEDKVIGEEHNDFIRFDRIVSNKKIFCGTDSELDNLKELVSLLKAM